MAVEAMPGVAVEPRRRQIERRIAWIFLTQQAFAILSRAITAQLRR